MVILNLIESHHHSQVKLHTVLHTIQSIPMHTIYIYMRMTCVTFIASGLGCR